MQRNYILRRTEILVLIANSKEYEGFIECLRENNVQDEVRFVYQDFELYAFKRKQYHICYMYINGTGPSHTTRTLELVANAFTNLKYIVNVGCCASACSPVKEEVIFADRMFDADARKEKNGKTKYAIYENKHYKFSNVIRMKLSNLSKCPYTIKYEPLIASSAVIKDEKTKKKYIDAYPYAAGIEMEGIAISNYALSRGIEWLVIKGTSDDGITKRGSKGQKEASKRSTDLFLRILDSDAFERAKTKLFVGGTVSEKASFKEKQKVEKSCYKLASELLKSNYKIISGLGRVVGTSMVSAVYAYKRDSGCQTFDDYMEIFPFPRIVDRRKKSTVEQFYSMNRLNMIEQCVLSLFVFGRNTKHGERNGLLEEFNIAGSKFIPRVVIPSDKYYSKSLYKTIISTDMEGIKSTNYRKNYRTLSDNIDFDKKIKTVVDLFEVLDDFYYSQNTK